MDESARVAEPVDAMVHEDLRVDPAVSAPHPAVLDEAEQRARSLSWMATPLAIALASRLFSASIIAWMGLFVTHRHSPLLTPYRSPFAAWDAQWYLEIATRGYHSSPIQGAHHDLAFFPAWPLLIRFGSILPVPIWALAAVLANVLAVVALVTIWRVFSDRFGETVATNGVLLLAFSPAAFVLSMAYSEPLFLFVAAASFLVAAGRSRIYLTGVSLLVRVSGGALVAASLAGALAARGGERTLRLMAAGAGVVALLAWMAGVAYITHNPLGFVREGSANWSNPNGVAALLTTIAHPVTTFGLRAAIVAVIAIGALFVLRRDLELGVYAIATLALILLPGALVQSYPRYALVAFPAFAGLAMRLGSRGSLVLAVGFAALQVLLVFQAFVPYGMVTP